MQPFAGLNPALAGLQTHLGGSTPPWMMNPAGMAAGQQTWGSQGNMFAPGAAAPPPMQVGGMADTAAPAPKMPSGMMSPGAPQAPKVTQVQMMAPPQMANAAPKAAGQPGAAPAAAANPAMRGLSRSLSRGQGRGVY